MSSDGSVTGQDQNQKEHSMKIRIPHRWLSTPVATEEVPDDSHNPLRAAVEQIVARGADLTDADLTGARLTDADLTGARLTDADLTGANLTGANLTDADLTGARLTRARLTRARLTGARLTDADLTGANLTGAREDFRSVLDTRPDEVSGLLLALREGRIDGSQYSGDCACLVGTIANVAGLDYHEIPGLFPDDTRPAERLFMAIAPGHLPSINPVAKIVEGWILEWQVDRGLSSTR